MNSWLFLLPFISAMAGWIIFKISITIFIEKILPQKQQAIAQKTGELVSGGLFSISDLEGKLVSDENMKKLMPVIEIHIDEFLRNRLGKALPVVSMFIGDKTINQLKEVFMKELEVIIPATMKAYVSNLEKDIDIKKLVTEKISALPPGKISEMIKHSMPQELRKIQLFGALAGFLIGALQLLLTFLMGH
jgi:uncharacterized membrane protein YheB (UPF0754 family)